MTITMYAPAIRDAIARKDVREMKDVLAQAKQIRKEQGDLDKAIVRLQNAIAKLTKATKKPAKKTAKKPAKRAAKKR